MNGFGFRLHRPPRTQRFSNDKAGKARVAPWFVFFLDAEKVLSLNFLLLVLLLVACDRQPEPHASVPIAATTVKEPAVTQENNAVMIDSLEQARATLSESFDYKKLDFGIPSYYHKKWWGRYDMASNILMAGVDSLGTFFLILNLNCSGSEAKGSPDLRHSFLPLDSDQEASGLQLELGDTTILVPMAMDSSGPQLVAPDPLLPEMPRVSTGRYCTEFYVPARRLHLEEYLAHHDLQSLTAYDVVNGKRKSARVVMGKEGRDAIRDCARLALIIRQLRRLGRAG
jgi:hypothetical protein